jgi:AmiR/NasT family two-component response regulator
VGAVEAYALLQDLSARRQHELTVVAQLVVDGTVTVDRWPGPGQE